MTTHGPMRCHIHRASSSSSSSFSLLYFNAYNSPLHTKISDGRLKNLCYHQLMNRDVGSGFCRTWQQILTNNTKQHQFNTQVSSFSSTVWRFWIFPKPIIWLFSHTIYEALVCLFFHYLTWSVSSPSFFCWLSVWGRGKQSCPETSWKKIRPFSLSWDKNYTIMLFTGEAYENLRYLNWGTPANPWPGRGHSDQWGHSLNSVISMNFRA